MNELVCTGISIYVYVYAYTHAFVNPINIHDTLRNENEQNNEKGRGKYAIAHSIFTAATNFTDTNAWY